MYLVRNVTHEYLYLCNDMFCLDAHVEHTACFVSIMEKTCSKAILLQFVKDVFKYLL